jgi:two-component system NtrC family sensor kinase
MSMADSNSEYNRFPHSRKLEDYHKLSQQVLYLVNLTGPLSDFVRKVSDLILEFTECDEAELVLIRDEKYYRSKAARIPDRSFSIEIECLPNNWEKQIDGQKLQAAPLERLILDILHGKPDTSKPFFTENGSFWTGNRDKPFVYGLLRDGERYERRLDIGGSHNSIALIPMKASGTGIGLLSLKSSKRDYFSEETIRLLEETVQTLSVVQAHRATQLALRERVKELTCLYDIAMVSEQKDISLEQLLLRIIELLPPAWQYPEITCCRIILDENTYFTPGFNESCQKQSAKILVKGEQRGIVEVIYTENKPEIYEGPFLREERNLLDAVAREVALIIERKEAEKAESELQDQLRHADRLATIGQLAAGVAHELNEPLGNILGFGQLIAKVSELPGQAKRDVEKIISSTLHAREIVKKLMYFARQMPPEKVKCDLNQIVEEGAYLLGARCAKAGIELIRELTADLPIIIADPSQLHQVLINLAVNSMQAMPEGGSLTVSTRADDDHVSLIVEDTGTGMDESVMKQIFVPFYTTKDIDEGTGLGLAVVHGIVSSHGGTIEVESEVGIGSKFVVRLPVKHVFPDIKEE